ncbi:MAG: VWA domain-containing protein [Candidatus Acidiferrales bacterium]
MRRLRFAGFVAAILSVVALGWFGRQLIFPGARVDAQNAAAANVAGQNTQAQNAGTPPASQQAAQKGTVPASGVIRSESNVVRVDVVVTDKKGNYIHDLTAKDFRLFEDKKQQEVTNFSFGGGPAAGTSTEKHYIVLFFDDSTMDVSDQPRARAAAAKFIDANAGPNRVMAVVEFGGALRIAQNFTADAARLKQAAAGVKTSAISPNASATALDDATIGGPMLGGPGLGTAESDFGAYSVLLAIRGLAKNLAAVPGRKSLILFTSGFALTPERESELTATIDACNKANVAVYPLDVRGLMAPMGGAESPTGALIDPPSATATRFAAFRSQPGADSASQPRLVLAAYRTPSPAEAFGQQRGGGAPRGGPGPGPGPGPGHGAPGPGPGHGGAPSPGPGRGGNPAPGPGRPGPGRGGNPGPSRPVNTPFTNPNLTQPREIVPKFPESASTNQQVLYALAEGTGGFPIFNSNDLLAGLEKIAREQDEYYLLGFSPANTAEGSCHTLKVKVERGGTEVRARSGFCNVKPADLLAGQPIEKDLEARAAGASAGNMAGTLEAPFFYTSPNEARVNLAMDVPSASVEFSKEKGKYHSDINVLGIAYRPDGTVAAKFSDEVKLDMEKDELKEFKKLPMHYENQFAIAPGTYRLTVVLSSGGQNFGKYETPLTIGAYDGKAFNLSGIALSDQLERVSDLGSDLDADMLADRTPLIVHQVELVPSGSNRFKKSDKVALYAQVYDPQLLDRNPPPVVEVAYQVVDQKTGKVVFSTGGVDATEFVEKGSAMVPVALKIPVDDLQPGTYRVELLAGENGRIFQRRVVSFERQ